MKVDVPQFYPQTDSETRHADRMCFSSTIAMAIKFLKPEALQGVNADDDYLRTVLKHGDTTNPEAHLKAIKEYGLEGFFATDSTWEDLEDALRAGVPVPVGWLHHGTPERPSGGHWTLLTGIYDGVTRHHDPYGVADMVNGGYVKVGPFGKDIEYTIERWKKRWMFNGQAWMLIVSDPNAAATAPESPEKGTPAPVTGLCPTCGQPLPTAAPVAYDGTFGSVVEIAARAGAKWPRVVAAQWALESGRGKHVSGKNNFFGLKGKSSSGTLHETKEFIDGMWVTISDSFIDFDSPEACITYLVERWYQDWNGYNGVNRAKSEEECCGLLQLEGYATDPAYSKKLMSIIEDS